MVIHLSFQPTLLHLLSPFFAIDNRFVYSAFCSTISDYWHGCYSYCSQCGQQCCFPHLVSHKRQLPQVWTPAAFWIVQRDWSVQPSNNHSYLGKLSAVWCFFSWKILPFQSLKSGRKGSPGLLSILPLPGSIFYPFCFSFLDNFFHRIVKNKMDQLSVFDKESVKNFSHT